jgi:hypothetical protein
LKQGRRGIAGQNKVRMPFLQQHFCAKTRCDFLPVVRCIRHPIGPHCIVPDPQVPQCSDSQRPCPTLRHATLIRRVFERIYFRTPRGMCASSSALPLSCPPITAHRAGKSAKSFAAHASGKPDRGLGVTPSAIPFQFRQCSTLVPLLVSHEMAANFDMRLC